MDWPALLVQGPDAASWLHGIITCDVHAARLDRAVWGSLLTKQGKVFADLLVVGSSDRIELAIPSGDAAGVLAELGRYLVMEDAEIEPSEVAWVVGRGTELSADLGQAGLSVASLPWGPPGLFLAKGPASELDALKTARGEKILDEHSFGRWLTSQGVPQFGLDYTSDDNLHAASLERRTVDWSKGCYLGQEVVCMQDMRGKVKRRLVRIVGEGNNLHTGEELMTSDGKSVGRVTSSAGRAALGSVTAPYFEPGTKLIAAGQPVRVAALF